MMRLLQLMSFAVAGGVFVASCGGGSTPVAISTETLDAAPCEDRFVRHDLEHLTTGGSSETSLFDGTGSGVTIVDIDRDGDDDLLLPNLSGWSTLHRNEGGMNFSSDPLVQGRFRQVAPVDLVGDDRVDLVLTTGVGRPLVLAQTDEGFVRSDLDAFTDVAYSVAWGDVDGDGDIDFATGSYNAELTAQRDVVSVMGRNSGVTFYENDDGSYAFRRMSDLAQALVVRFGDVDGDDSLDLMVGNDLATPDELWLRDEGRWVPTEMFDRTTFSTMSLDAADVDNDGDLDLYATDMHPMSNDAETLEAWEPVMADMEALPRVDDVQAMENVLLVAERGRYVSSGGALGVSHTGWSWSGVFGDLDNDGFVDLYVVNGMESPAMFPDLDGGALVEENQAFRNREGVGFAPVPEWGLGDTAGGRGMAMADLDSDGDLDIVVNNLNAPARLYENQLCGGAALTARLHWAATGNADALGTRIELETDAGDRLTRVVEANRGYLSSSGSSVHFGLGTAVATTMTVTWPDGQVSTLDDLGSNVHLEITREGM